MMSKKQEQRSFSNGPLRDQWEKRAQSIADECKQEAQWREKSALKVLFSKWTYHWSLVSNGDKMKDELSDFSKLTRRASEENNQPKIKFKIVPPPPKPKTESPPPPALPRKKASPKARRPKRKVEVDVFQLCWRESWMSLKPPKYLYLKAKELKTRFLGFTNIELTNSRKYKAKGCGSEAELTFPHDKWSNSWKQVKRRAQLEPCQGKQLQWEILFERQRVWTVEIEKYSLPPWAGTWKFINFAFRQQKQKWDGIWPDYQQNLSNTSDRLQQVEEQVGINIIKMKMTDELLDWDNSWQLSGQKLELKDTTDDETLTVTSSSCAIAVTVRINDVFLPSWMHSWLLSAACLEKDEEYQHNWCTSWGYRQQIRWRKASLTSHYQHSNMLTRRRKTMNLLLTSDLDDSSRDDSEWLNAWHTPKQGVQLQDELQEEEEEEEEEELEEQKEVEQMTNYTEEKDERVDNVENVKVDEEEEKNEDVDEDEMGGEKGNEEEDEREEDVDKNEEDQEERDEEVHKEDKEYKLNEEDEEHKEEGDEWVDEEEEEEAEVSSEEKDKQEAMLEEDEVNQKDENSEVEEEEKKDPYKENSEEEDEEDRNINKNTEEDEVDEEEDEEENENEEEESKEEEELEDNEVVSKKNKEEVDEEDEVPEKDEEEENDDEEEIDVDDDEDISKKNNKEVDDEEDEVDEKDQEKENDDEEEIDVEDDEDVSKKKKEEVDDEEDEVDENDEAEENDDEEEIDVEDDEDGIKKKKEEVDDEEDEVDEKDEEEENDDEEEIDVADDEDVSKKNKEQEVMKKEEAEEEEDEEEGVKGDDGHDRVDEMHSKAEKETKVKTLQKQVPLHLQFHKLKAPLTSWEKSWMVAVAHRGGEDKDEEEGEDWGAWKESWRICRRRRPDTDEVTCFSTEHRCQRCMRLRHEEDSITRSEWKLSWRINTAVKEEDSEQEEEEDEEDEEEEEEER